MFQWRYLSLLVAAAALTGTGDSASAQTVLKYNNWLPPAHNQLVLGMRPWAAEVEKATNGRVKIEFPPASLGAPVRQYDLAFEGVADIVAAVHGYTPGRFKLTGIAELPFVGDTSEQRSIAYWRVHEKFLAKAGEHKGVVVLAVFAHGPGSIMSREPITTTDGFKGRKMRVGGGIIDKINPALGGVNVAAPATEVHDILSKGIADGVFFPSEAFKVFKLDGSVKAQTIVPGGLYSSTWTVVINKATFDKLPPEDQKALMSVSGEHLVRIHAKAWDAADKAGIEAMQQAGVKRVNADEKFLADIKEKTAFLEQDWLKDAAAAGVDGPAALKMFKDEVAKLKATN
ncbi:MAG: TRAP transporter substrate-binding protein [Bradyrhizobiaceae bacterium]|nr:TRAP transporter substrate-binding protein [Bradyrhizobiaceae bacterium]